MKSGKHDRKAEPNAKQQVRAVFASDLHLGFRHARVAAFLEMLQRFEMESLYLVGDILDGWRLSRRWYWNPLCDALVDHVLHLVDRGVGVFYTPGNHDEFLRQPMPAVHGIEVADEVVHTSHDGRRFLVTHSDLFDDVEKRFHGISQLGSRVYDGLMMVNSLTNRMLGAVGVGEFNYCFGIKRLSKSLVGSASAIPAAVAERARERQCDGVIFGHLHRPSFRNNDDILLLNTGDWVEHQSFVIETLDGRYQLYDKQRLCREVVKGAIVKS